MSESVDVTGAGSRRRRLAASVTEDRRRFSFVTPPLTGIKADKDYAVVVRVIDADGAEVQRVETKIHSDLDQSILPDVPLTVGPLALIGDPISPWVAVPGLLVVCAALLGAAALMVRRLEIRYGND